MLQSATYLLTESWTLRTEGRWDGIGNDASLLETTALPVEVYMFLQFHVIIFDVAMCPRTDTPMQVQLVLLLRNSSTCILAAQSEELYGESAIATRLRLADTSRAEDVSVTYMFSGEGGYQCTMGGWRRERNGEILPTVLRNRLALSSSCVVPLMRMVVSGRKNKRIQT
jgi:hypothetical protein